MSCGEPHETDCSEVLDHLYEYLDREMPDSDCAKFQEHFDECSPCLEKYGLEQEVKKLVKRCCGHDDVPSDLRSKVMGRIEMIRAGEAGTAGQGGQGQERASASPTPASPAPATSAAPAAQGGSSPADAVTPEGGAERADKATDRGAERTVDSTAPTAAPSAAPAGRRHLA